MSRESILLEKGMSFAIRIVNLYKWMEAEKKEYVMSKQILRSGTSIGANAREAIYGQSKNDFVAKMSIALKEASETEYWLELLSRTEYITSEQYESIKADCVELIKMLTATVKKSKE